MPEQVTELLDAYEVERRDQVLSEAAAIVLASPTGHRQTLARAAQRLLAARTIQPAQDRPVILCELPHPVAPDTWCALRIEHDGWHEDGDGDRWPNLLLAARTAPDAR